MSVIPIEDRIQRYEVWRKRLPAARPMIGFAWEPEVPPLAEMMARVGVGQEFSPNDIDPKIVLPELEKWYQADCQVHSETIQSFGPALGIPWVEAMAGCPVVAYPGSLWAEAAVKSLDDRPQVRFDPDNAWLQKAVELTRVMVDCSAGRFPVCLPLMRGPLDTLAALRTPAQMCLDMVDQPQAVHRILGEITELWIGIAETLLRLIPPFHGGYCTRMRMWAPGQGITPQNDVSSLISPRTYEKFGLPYDRRITARFPFSSFHMHSTEHHQMDELVKLEDLTALQMFLQHHSGGPPMTAVLPSLKRTLASKPLLLGVPDAETADTCLAELPSAGLCLMMTAAGVEITEENKEWLRRHC
jgi:hypothetical protein